MKDDNTSNLPDDLKELESELEVVLDVSPSDRFEAGLKSAMKSELKPKPKAFNILPILSIAAALLIATGIYFYLNKTESPVDNKQEFVRFIEDAVKTDDMSIPSVATYRNADLNDIDALLDAHEQQLLGPTPPIGNLLVSEE